MNQELNIPTEARLQRCIRTALPEYGKAEVVDLKGITSGWETDVYAFDLTVQDVTRPLPLVLRVYQGQHAREKSALEFDALRRLHSVGYPVPKTLALALEDSPAGRPCIIMERIAGQGMWRKTFQGPEEQQRTLFALFLRLFVQLHQLEWHYLVDDTNPPFLSNPYHFVDAEVASYRGRSAQLGVTTYGPVMDWLEARRDLVPCHRPAPIHWDFHPENILLCDDGSAVVIDWSQYQISDPRFDLAWTMTLVGGQEGGNVRERILSMYEALTGEVVQHIEIFEVFACVKRLASVMISLSLGAEVMGMRAGSEQMMLKMLPAMTRVYARLQEISGIRIPEVEKLLKAV